MLLTILTVELADRNAIGDEKAKKIANDKLC